MPKQSEIDLGLLQKAVAAVEACWNEGSPVAGQTTEEWERTAQVILRRIRSMDRRNFYHDDFSKQLRYIAEGMVQEFERDPNLVGPLIVDYMYVAERVLNSIGRSNS